jgi:hypothetical protein
VTVIGLPLAIGVFLFEQRKERENEEEELHQLSSGLRRPGASDLTRRSERTDRLPPGTWNRRWPRSLHGR